MTQDHRGPATAGWNAVAGRSLRSTAMGGEAVVASLADIAPDSRPTCSSSRSATSTTAPGLDLRAREIATIAALTAMGNATPRNSRCTSRRD